MRGVDRWIDDLAPARNVDAEFGDEPLATALWRGTVDRERAAVANERPVAGRELVAPGVTAEVVVVVEDEDAGRGPSCLRNA